MFNCENHTLSIDGSDMDYVSFGRGKRPLIMLPGLSDALKTVKGSAILLALLYRKFAGVFRVFVFSRKNRLAANCTIRDMAADQARACELLGLSSACVVGVSQGGMIALHLAAEHPQLVKKLVLANTAACANDTVTQVVGNWLQLAKAGNFSALFADTTEKTYSEKKLRLYRPFYPLLCAANSPKDMQRFIIEASCCLTFDANALLKDIKCPTLVIGGEQDKIVGADAARQLAAGITGSKLIVYPELGHGAFEEAADFNARVLEFCTD